MTQPFAKLILICIASIGFCLLGSCGGSTTDGNADATTDTGGDTIVEQDTGPKPKCGQGSACYAGQCCTCSPPKDCEEGIDNMLSGIASLANSSLQGSVDDGSVNILTEFGGDTANGAVFSLRMYTGDLDPSNADCNVITDACSWHLSLAAIKADCSALISFENATIVDGKLTAGGADGVFQLSLPIANIELVLTVSRARIEADVTMEGDQITGISGILAGAIAKKALQAAIEALDPEDLPISKDVIMNILSNVIKEDIDTLDADDNPGSDGVLDSSSVAIKFEAIPATITGFESPEPSAACVEYCDLASTNCTEDNAIDFGGSTCETACAAMAEGTTGDTSGNTAACRIYHLGVAATDAAAHCPHGNLAGGSDAVGFPCTDPAPEPSAACVEYCDLASTNCTEDNTIDFGDSTCEDACAAMAEGTTGDTSGNTVACRIYHLGVAADAPGAHCPHANLEGGSEAAGFPCTDPAPLPPLEFCPELPTTFGQAFRIRTLQLGTSGMVGEGLDIDGTCVAPDAALEEWCPAE